MTRPLAPELVPLLGCWRIGSAIAEFSGTGERGEHFGPDPEGRMIFEPGGRIMFLFTRSGRSVPTNDAEKAALFDGMVAYSGRVRLVTAGCFATDIDRSWQPGWSGEQVRYFQIEGDVLTIWTDEQPYFDGRRFVARLIFERE